MHLLLINLIASALKMLLQFYYKQELNFNQDIKINLSFSQL